LGTIVINLWPEAAPETVKNFKKLASNGFYDGTRFHRIVKGFMVQGGDPLTKDLSQESRWGAGGPGYQIKAEFNDRSHTRGVISMARAAQPDSAGSQFFICLGDAKHLDLQYTAFGSVIKGDDVLEKIGDTPVGRSSTGEQSRPLNPVTIESIRTIASEPSSSTPSQPATEPSQDLVTVGSIRPIATEPLSSTPSQPATEPPQEIISKIMTNAEQGDRDAQYALGMKFASGDGVSKDVVEAYAWLHRAAERGHSGALMARYELSQSMTQSQIAEGKARVSTASRR
jgi:peptidyl-prolyl cis-trans isomerase B (cyclophilin B)